MGNILFHCLPKLRAHDNPFDFTMRSVLVAQKGLISSVKNKKIFDSNTVKQNKDKEIRYSKNKDFTDKIASEFLQFIIQLNSIEFSYPELINQVFG